MIDGWERWPSELWPKARMFLSADIVGSTALKQSTVQTEDGLAIPDNSKWFEVIQYFYIRSVYLLFDQFKLYKESEKKKTSFIDRFRPGKVAEVSRPAFIDTMSRPHVWKTIGDEILFWVDIEDTRQVAAHLSCWVNAMKQMRSDLIDINPRLSLKCTAWMAHFPWRNKMTFSSRSGFTGAEYDGVQDNNLQLMYLYLKGNPGDLTADFVGPGIDIGFRLTTKSTARRFVLGVDVAYMLAKGMRSQKADLPFKIHFDGLEAFKGVLGGLEYPVFWVDMSSADAVDTFGSDLGKRTPCDSGEIINFCESFYDERSNYLYRPFVVSPTEEVLAQRPSWYDATHQQMLAEAKIQQASSPEAKRTGS